MDYNQKGYTVVEVADKLGLTKSQVYYRFQQLEEYVYIDQEDDVKKISQEGFDIISKDSGVRKQADNNQNSLEGVYNQQIQDLKKDVDYLKERLEFAERELAEKNNTIERLLDLNRNNQVLLLEKEKKEKVGFFQKLFATKNEEWSL